MERKKVTNFNRGSSRKKLKSTKKSESHAICKKERKKSGRPKTKDLDSCIAKPRPFLLHRMTQRRVDILAISQLRQSKQARRHPANLCSVDQLPLTRQSKQKFRDNPPSSSTCANSAHITVVRTIFVLLIFLVVSAEETVNVGHGC